MLGRLCGSFESFSKQTQQKKIQELTCWLMDKSSTYPVPRGGFTGYWNFGILTLSIFFFQIGWFNHQLDDVVAEFMGNLRGMVVHLSSIGHPC